MKLKNLYYALLSTMLLLPVVVDARFESPLKSGLDTVAGFTEAFLRAVVFILFPIAVLFVVYSGFLFVAAQGNSETLEKAKKNFLWTIIGVGLLLGAWALAMIIRTTIGDLTG